MAKRTLVLIGILCVMYFVSRLWDIKNLPWFVDEVIYARWAQMGYYDSGSRLVSLGDGKPPLFIWAVTWAMSILRNPITAARLVAVASGMVTALGIFAVSRELFRKDSAGLISMFLYICFPLALLLNRFGLMDSMVGMFAIWSLYGEIILVRRLGWDTMFALALIWAGGVLTKTSGYMAIYLTPISLVLFRVDARKSYIAFLHWILRILLAWVLASLYTQVIHLSPAVDFIETKNELFLYSPQELISGGVSPIATQNLGTLTRWSFAYLTPGFIILLIVGIPLLKQVKREAWVLGLWFLVPFAGLAFFGKSLASRYVLPFYLPLFVLAGYVVSQAYNAHVTMKKGVLFFLSLTFVWMGYIDVKLLFDLSHAPIPQEDVFQYANGWPAGNGMKQIVAYLQDVAKDKKIYVLTEGRYGSLPTTAVEIFLFQNVNVQRDNAEFMVSTVPINLREKAKELPVYIITNQMKEKITGPIDLIREYRKGDGEYYLRLYQVQQI